ncbi:hypothetical protein ACIRPT_11980 [Streptomyces sp. NPDC101227]|uniref:hypothetical protein n=1 Tax=Streptomyces sp. NPDC101227 TaxID=3366136 RepID=UPI003810CA22
MFKLRKAAVVVAVLGSVGLLGAGTAYAGGGSSNEYSQQEKSSGDNYGKSGGYGHHKSSGDKIEIRQGTSCRSEDVNVDVLGEVGIANGLGGNLGGGEGQPGSQSTVIGSSMGCNNSVG